MHYRRRILATPAALIMRWGIGPKPPLNKPPATLRILWARPPEILSSPPGLRHNQRSNPLSRFGLLSTHILLSPQVLGDPPKSPLKRGTLIPVPPFLRGARGARFPVSSTLRTYVYLVARFGRGAGGEGKPRVAISTVEHKAVLDTCEALHRQGQIDDDPDSRRYPGLS